MTFCVCSGDRRMNSPPLFPFLSTPEKRLFHELQAILTATLDILSQADSRYPGRLCSPSSGAPRAKKTYLRSHCGHEGYDKRTYPIPVAEQTVFIIELWDDNRNSEPIPRIITLCES
jgi:hypothetical protein